MTKKETNFLELIEKTKENELNIKTIKDLDNIIELDGEEKLQELYREAKNIALTDNMTFKEKEKIFRDMLVEESKLKERKRTNILNLYEKFFILNFLEKVKKEEIT